MKYIISSLGYYVGFSGDNYEFKEGELEVPFAPQQNLINPRWDNNKWEEGASEEEILEFESQQNEERKKLAHEQLKETDWYVIRFQETGKPIPQEIIDLRQAIRDSY